MINAAVVGLGTWGKTMVESLAGGSDAMRFTVLQTRTVKPDVEAFGEGVEKTLDRSYASREPGNGVIRAKDFPARLKDPSTGELVNVKLSDA